MIGQTISHYRVTAKLGAGGMGEVYRATDTKLGREVALKVLPDAFAKDAQRMQRFQREAQVLASLNHPHIAAIHSLEHEGKVQALAMELVEGPTLAERIAQGAIPWEEALPIAKQIAEALEYAHERGIVHRDLKPANIKLTAAGQVKVLDFGLAKALSDDSVVQDISNSPTLSMAATKAGFILGTAAYMSPEQAKGKSVDRRTDVWAFGCVLYEMLTGRRAYGGEDVSETLAAIIRGEPDWSALPARLPASAQRIVRRSLEKDLRQRLQAIGEARIAIEDCLLHPAEESSTAEARTARAGLSWPAMAALAILPALLVGALVWKLRPSAVALEINRAQITLPHALPLDYQGSLALSPDGRQLVFAGRSEGKHQLYIRRMGEFEAKAIPGTEGGGSPFFSPDGKSLGFPANGKLKIVSLSGGAPVEIADCPSPQGAAWGRDDTIIFNRGHGEGLWRVPASGGMPQEVSKVDPSKGEAGHHWPALLPDGKHILFTIEVDGKPYDEAVIVVQSLETGARQTLIQGGTDGRYIPTGHLVYWTGGNLLAVPFDAAQLRVTGPPRVVVRDVMMGTANGFAQLTFSEEGTLVYLAGQDSRTDMSLVRVDRSGRPVALPVPARAYAALQISPDGRRLAVTIVGANDNLWLYEFGRTTLTRFTFDKENAIPVWSPDGRRVAFARHAGGDDRDLHWVTLDGSGSPEELFASPNNQGPSSWSRDGKHLVFTEEDPGTGSDIWVLPMEGERKPQVFLKTKFNERFGHFSPDGRWIVYSSDLSGEWQVYVRPFPGPGSARQISVEGADEPIWAGNGREIFFRHGNKVLAVEVRTQPDFQASSPRLLFEATYVGQDFGAQMYDAFPDWSGFIFVRQNTDPSTKKTLNVVFNWFEELRGLAAEGKAKQ